MNWITLRNKLFPSIALKERVKSLEVTLVKVAKECAQYGEDKSALESDLIHAAKVVTDLRKKNAQLQAKIDIQQSTIDTYKKLSIVTDED